MREKVLCSCSRIHVELGEDTMGKNNLLRKMTPERKNYRLYKAKKRWITACATFMFTLGISAGLNINNNAEANAEVEETPVTSAAGSAPAHPLAAVLQMPIHPQTARRLVAVRLLAAPRVPAQHRMPQQVGIPRQQAVLPTLAIQAP